MTPTPPASTPAGQSQAAVATVYVALAVLGDQLEVATALGPGLQTLITRVQSLAGGDPAVRSLLVQLQEPGDSTPTVGSLVRRVVLLRLLLESLTRTDPSAARRLAPALPALHSLLVELLLAARQGSALTGGHDPRTNGLATGIPRPLLALEPDVVLAGAVSFAPAAQAYDSSSAQGVSTHTQRRPGAERMSPASASVREVPPASAPLPAGGAAGSANGGMASAAPAAAALLAALAVWLLHPLLAGRVMLDLSPWRSALVGSRLERPG